jgi:hypothetical protein
MQCPWCDFPVLHDPVPNWFIVRKLPESWLTRLHSCGDRVDDIVTVLRGRAPSSAAALDAVLRTHRRFEGNAAVTEACLDTVLSLVPIPSPLPLDCRNACIVYLLNAVRRQHAKAAQCLELAAQHYLTDDVELRLFTETMFWLQKHVAASVSPLSVATPMYPA